VVGLGFERHNVPEQGEIAVGSSVAHLGNVVQRDVGRHAHARVALLGDARDGIVKDVQRVALVEARKEVDSLGAVALRVERRRPDADAHQVGHDSNDAAGDTGLGGQADGVRKLCRSRESESTAVDRSEVTGRERERENGMGCIAPPL